MAAQAAVTKLEARMHDFMGPEDADEVPAQGVNFDNVGQIVPRDLLPDLRHALRNIDQTILLLGDAVTGPDGQGTYKDGALYAGEKIKAVLTKHGLLDIDGTAFPSHL